MSVARPVILVLAFSDLARDPRVNRQIRFLADDYRVIASGFGDPGIPGVEFIRVSWPYIPPLPNMTSLQRAMWYAARIRNVGRRAKRTWKDLKTFIPFAARRARAFEERYWGTVLMEDCVAKLGGLKPDLIIANDLETLPLALRLARGAPVVYDAHEYAPREYDNSLLFRTFTAPYRRYLTARYAPEAGAMTTVCQGIAEAYEADTGVRPSVVTNAPDYEPSLSPRLVHDDTATIRLIHHGLAAPVRRIENMIRMMDYLDDRFELTLMLVPSVHGYLRQLERMAAGNPRVRFIAPVPMRDIPRVSNEYDIGLFLLAPTNFNYLHALPNKFFEFIQARLAVAVGPSPEMARLVRQYDLGVVSDEFTPESLAGRLASLRHADINTYKTHADLAARELSAENNRTEFLRLVRELVGR